MPSMAVKGSAKVLRSILRRLQTSVCLMVSSISVMTLTPLSWAKKTGLEIGLIPLSHRIEHSCWDSNKRRGRSSLHWKSPLDLDFLGNTYIWSLIETWIRSRERGLTRNPWMRSWNKELLAVESSSSKARIKAFRSSRLASEGALFWQMRP